MNQSNKLNSCLRSCVYSLANPSKSPVESHKLNRDAGVGGGGGIPLPYGGLGGGFECNQLKITTKYLTYLE